MKSIRMSFGSFFCSENLRQFMKFSFVGCSNIIVSFVVFYLCYKHWPFATILLNWIGSVGIKISSYLQGIGHGSFDGAFANAAGYVCGTINSFVWNKTWTFRVFPGTWKQAKRFILVNILSLLLGTIIILILVDIMKGPYKLIWAFSTGLTTILNFLCYKYWTFQKQVERRSLILPDISQSR